MTGISRRRFAGIAGATVAAGLAPSWTPANADEREFEAQRHGGRLPRPNLLVILADDLGWADLSAYGAPDHPHAEPRRAGRLGRALHERLLGVVGLLPHALRPLHRPLPGAPAGGLPEPIGAPNPQHGIPLDHPTLASLLKEQGYDTALIGKWHCGYLPWFSPTRLGWDEFFGNFSGGLDYFSKINHNGAYDLYEDEVEYEDLRYYTHILTERATEFLGRRHGARGC